MKNCIACNQSASFFVTKEDIDVALCFRHYMEI